MQQRKSVVWITTAVIALLILGGWWNGLKPKSEPSVIKIGALLPLTGKLAGYGEDIRNAMTLAQEALAKRGSQFEVVYEDSAADSKTALSGAQKLIEADRVPFVIGGPGATANLSVAPAFEAGQVLFFPISNTPKLNDAGEYIFKLLYDVEAEMKPMVVLLQEKGIKRVGVLYDSASDSNVVGAKAFQAEFEKIGGKVVFNQGFDSKTTNDFRSQLTLLKATAPDALYQVTPEKIAGVVVRQARELGLSIPLFSWSGINGSDFFSGAGTYAEGVIITDQPFSCATTPNDYCATYSARYADRIPQQYGAITYDLMMILEQAIKELDIKGPNINTEEKKKLIAYFTDHTYSGMSGVLKFDAEGNIRDKDFVFRVAKDGKFVDVK